ncbi:MAG: hypothetical protein H8E13_13125 [Actinobacteria bacterium]|nr:hypothetical protein [Actinomycetota bacterium]
MRTNAAGETVNTWNVEHIYRHSENAIIVFLLLLFIASLLPQVSSIFLEKEILKIKK